MGSKGAHLSGQRTISSGSLRRSAAATDARLERQDFERGVRAARKIGGADARGLKQAHWLEPCAEVASARDRTRQQCGVRLAYHLLAVLRVAHPQTHAEVRVLLDLIVDRARWCLCRQDQVDAKAASNARHVDQTVDELGQIILEARELVDDDDQERHRLALAATK